MQEDVRDDLKSQLALMIARGKPINAWASQNDVPLPTAYRWSGDPQVRGEVQEWRRYVLNPGAPGLARLSMKATDGIAKLGAGAESESVQLRAWRAVLADQMAVAKFSVLEDRMTEIEEQLDKRAEHTNQARNRGSWTVDRTYNRQSLASSTPTKDEGGRMKAEDSEPTISRELQAKNRQVSLVYRC